MKFEYNKLPFSQSSILQNLSQDFQFIHFPVQPLQQIVTRARRQRCNAAKIRFQFIISFATTERIIPLLPVYRSSRKLDHRRSPGHRGGQTAPKTAGSGNFSDVLWVTDVSARTQTGEQTRGPHAGEQEHGHLRFESPPLVGHTDLHRLPTLACSSGTSSDFAIYIYSQDPCWIYITVCSWLSNRADRERKQHLDPPCSLESV